MVRVIPAPVKVMANWIPAQVQVNFCNSPGHGKSDPITSLVYCKMDPSSSPGHGKVMVRQNPSPVQFIVRWIPVAGKVMVRSW